VSYTESQCAYFPVSCTVIQDILWVLIGVSLLLTVRAIWSGSWQTMWAAALVSLAFCLIAIWSIGSLLFLLTCLQLVAAIAMRRAVDLRGWAALILAGGMAFVLVVYGLATLRAHESWAIAFPLAFAIGSLPLFSALPAWRR
jgi:hypothetical protein